MSKLSSKNQMNKQTAKITEMQDAKCYDFSLMSNCPMNPNSNCYPSPNKSICPH